MSIADTQSDNRAAHCKSLWQHFDTALFSPKWACLAAVLLGLTILGCMNFAPFPSQVEIKTTADTPGMLAQDGKIPERPGKEQIVYYPVPYASPPNLTLTDNAKDCDIVEQKENYFRIRFLASAKPQQEVTWTARGVRVPLPGDATPVSGATAIVPVSTIPPGTK